MTNPLPKQPGNQAALALRYRQVRAFTETLCEPLIDDDYQIQSIVETSPPKWHVAHVTWFFETFVLPDFVPSYRPFDERFAYLFNSYYETVGDMQPRPKRGLLARPSVAEVYRYRAHVDEQMHNLLHGYSGPRWDDLSFRVELGLNHEQQHQELLLMDIKHNFSVNPLGPAYRGDLTDRPGEAVSLDWLERPEGVVQIGHSGGDFAYDNETPRHRQLVQPHKLAKRLVTNGEYLAFMADQGYARTDLWLADGWHHIHREGWTKPLYWRERDGQWQEFTLGGWRELDPNQPVCHVSFYEADAYARWAGKRLPTEAELETQLADQPVAGNFVEQDALHPQAAAIPGNGQWYGDLWEWTNTPYGPFPGFKPLAGSMGEYNGKFMCNQMTLKGGCCVTSRDHMRPSYRNFFYPHDRWPFTGIRLAEDLL